MPAQPFDFEAHQHAIEQQLIHNLYVTTDTHAESYFGVPNENTWHYTISWDHRPDGELRVRLDNENHLADTDPDGDSTPTYRHYRVRVVLEPLD